MTTITIERAVLLRALEALRPATAPNGAKRDAAFEELRAALAAPATAPEKTVKEIMEFVRHYAANTFSSATLEDKIRRSLATPATAQVLTPLQDGEKIYALWHSSDANDLDDFLDGWRHAEAFHGIKGDKP